MSAGLVSVCAPRAVCLLQPQPRLHRREEAHQLAVLRPDGWKARQPAARHNHRHGGDAAGMVCHACVNQLVFCDSMHRVLAVLFLCRLLCFGCVCGTLSAVRCPVGTTSTSSASRCARGQSPRPATTSCTTRLSSRRMTSRG